MSFILDALKKAESERNRQSGPVLMHARLAPPRRHLPAWGWVLGVVLLGNLAFLGWLLLRPASAPDVADQAPAAVAAPVQDTATTPSPAPVVTPPASTVQADATATSPPAAPPDYLDPDSLPTAQELLASGVNLPALQLNLHVYDPAPQNRFVMLNAARMREGEFTPDGIKVERITPRGVVLEASGRRFLMVRAGG